MLAMLSVGCATTDPSRLQIEQSASQVSVFTASGRQVLMYHLRPPPGTKLAVESGGFFHSLTLRYQVVAADGDVPTELLNRLAKEWSAN